MIYRTFWGNSRLARSLLPKSRRFTCHVGRTMVPANRHNRGVGIGVVTKERPIQIPSQVRQSATKCEPMQSGLGAPCAREFLQIYGRRFRTPYSCTTATKEWSEHFAVASPARPALVASESHPERHRAHIAASEIAVARQRPQREEFRITMVAQIANARETGR